MVKIDESTITVEKIQAFKDSLNVGDYVKVAKPVLSYESVKDGRIRVFKAMVLAKYPYIVDTTDGQFTYTDLYIWKTRGIANECSN